MPAAMFEDELYTRIRLGQLQEGEPIIERKMHACCINPGSRNQRRSPSKVLGTPGGSVRYKKAAQGEDNFYEKAFPYSTFRSLTCGAKTF